MKKLISLMLALIMVFSLATVAAAEQTGTIDTTGWKSDAVTEAITMNKVYTVTGTSNTALYPAETLNFTSTPADTNPDKNANLSVDALTVTGNTNQTITINLPVYSKVGIYDYTIKETKGTTQGVTYSTAEIGVKVLVTYDYTNSKLATQVVLSTSKGEGETGKVDTFDNGYKVGTMTVKKTIDGNLASSDQYFTMTVTFSATNTAASAITVSGGSNSSNPTTVTAEQINNKAPITFYLRANETLTFVNIPDGVSYTVAEDSKHAAADTTGSDASKGYTVTYTNETGSISADESAETIEKAVTVNNYKNQDVSTGIITDSAPYIILIAVCAVAAVAFVLKRRNAVEF